MPAVIDARWCQACRARHTLCLPTADRIGVNLAYEYECPFTRKAVQFSLPDLAPYRVDPACPSGAVLFRPVMR